MNSRNIDKTHVIALKQSNGVFCNVELPIHRPEQFISELEAMIANPNRTVWDMQSQFKTRFSDTRVFMDYLYPYSYESSYVSGIGYPKVYEYDVLQEMWRNAGKEARQSYIDSCERQGSAPDYQSADQTEMDAISILKKRQKSDFFRDASRWIDANCYHETTQKLNRDKSIIMHSKENIGWSNFTHRVNEDIQVALKTNFGFGSAAYFLLGVQYRGFEILPYSYIVKYYKASMADIVRCTRSYCPSRESWAAAFDFLTDFINKSIRDPETFVESYIMNEVIEMMRGLEAIAENPKDYMERIRFRTADPCIVNVRPMFGDDSMRMQSYPTETPILFKVEKLTGALDFLKSLTEIAKEVKTIQPYIDRLLEINMALYPEVQAAMAKIGGKIQEQGVIKEEFETKIKGLTEQLAPFETEIAFLRAAATPEKSFNLSQYESSHGEYVMMKTKKRDLHTQLANVNRRIYDFKSFQTILESSLSKIDKIREIQEAA